MPTQIHIRTPDGQENGVNWIFPGDTSFIDRGETGAEGLGKYVVLVCCDNNDECTDIFVIPTPEGITSPSEEVDLDEACVPENIVARLENGEHHALDMQKLDLSAKPLELVMRHRVLMYPN